MDLSLKLGVFPHDTGWRRHGSDWSAAAPRCRTGSVESTPRCGRSSGRTRLLFMAGEVARAGIPVIVTVRNPWAVAASFKRLGWGFDVAGARRRLQEAGRDAGPPRSADRRP